MLAIKTTNKVLLTAFVILSFILYTYAYAFTCQITRVLDGDTFHCLPEKAHFGVKVHKDCTISVRMCGIAAPEKSQAFGKHVLRYTRAIELLRSGIPVTAVQQLMRHASLNTTTIYLRYINIEIQGLMKSKGLI